MAIRDILTAGHPTLYEPTRELATAEITGSRTTQLIEDLVETMRARGGAGLAANQVGEAVRVCVIEVREGNPRYPFLPTIPLRVMINPRITPLSDAPRLPSYEGCLSVPGLRGLVLRHEHIRVGYLDEGGELRTVLAQGTAAIVFQHEVDHLDGRLFLDLVTDPRTLVTTESFERWHRDPWLLRLRAAEIPGPEIIDG